MLAEELSPAEGYDPFEDDAEDEIEEEYLELELDLVWAQELSIQALLNRRDRPFTKVEACTLCTAAIVNGLSGDLFAALLDCCPPLEEFLTISRVDCHVPEFWGYLGLVELAAYLGREELLDILLLRGGNVNARLAFPEFPVSPLEAAVWGGHLPCVARLVQEPALQLAFTAHLQRLWAKRDLEPGQRKCLQLLAPALTGLEYPDSGPVPIPEALLPAAAAEMGNVELFARMCRERAPLTADMGNGSVQMLWARAALMGEQDGPDMLLALLEAFPAATRRRECRALLLLSGANAPGDARLDPWLRRLKNRALPLELLEEHFPGWGPDGPMTRKAVQRIELL